MIFNKKQLELGFSGLALLRISLIGKNNVAESIVIEMSKLLESGVGGSKSTTGEVKRYDISNGYREWSKTYDSIPNLLIQVEEPAVSSLIIGFKKGIALDAACGTGRYSKILSSLGHEVIGVDSSQHMLKLARSKVPKAKFIKGKLEKLPIESESVDLAISLSTFFSAFSLESFSDFTT